MRTAFAIFIFAATMIPQVSAQEPKAVNYTTLSAFEYTEGMELPEDITALDGQLITVSGFMTSEDGSQGDVDEFVLVNDACGCEGRPFLNEMIFCYMPEGQTATIKPGGTSVTGILHVGEVEEDGVVVMLYWMSVVSVQ